MSLLGNSYRIIKKKKEKKQQQQQKIGQINYFLASPSHMFHQKFTLSLIKKKKKKTIKLQKFVVT